MLLRPLADLAGRNQQQLVGTGESRAEGFGRA
jgi:hypothetical protein